MARATRSLGTRIRERRDRRGSGGIGLAPLIDVLFLLLIFLLVSANFDRRRVLDVSLPSVRSSQPAPKVTSRQERVITLRADGSLEWNRVPTKIDALMAMLGRKPPEERLLPIFIRGDGKASLGAGLRLLARLRDIGYTDCHFEVLPEPKQP